MSKQIRILLILVTLFIPACMAPGMIGFTPESTPAHSPGGSSPAVQAPANSTATATPFMPLPPTSTYVPTDFPTPVPTEIPTEVPAPANQFTNGASKSWDDYAGPTVWPDIDLPAPVGILPQPEGQVNIVLLGSDQRQDDYGFRTDTILLLTLDPSAGTANITSFPRDLYVYIPGWTVQRINTAFPHGGFDTLSETFEYNFGVSPDYYVLINFWSFTQVIDTLDGIDVNVGAYLSDHRDKYGNYSVSPGIVHMDGETALWYVRARYSTSDFDRGRRQQEVIQAIFMRLLSLNAVSRAPELFDIYKRNVTTDIALEDITPLLPLAANLSDSSLIHHYYIGPEQVISFRNSSGAAVLLPIREAVLEVMRQALNSP
ncbi:MAG: hypothetical protein EHM70_00440 [Chloroflexota bacterium]|nr:MAG: hypothetical protein EHM70_00440 [Chloroflexota bacterium]